MMNFDIVKKAAGRTLLQGKKWAPEILTAAGVVGVVTASVMGAKATLKLEEQIEKIETGKRAVEELIEKDPEYTERDKRNDLTYVYVRGTKEIVKLYAPAVTLGVASLAMILSSHGIMRRRNASLVAAYKVLETSFREYRDRVVEKYGEDQERDIYRGIVREEVEIEGKKEVVAVSSGMSPYARYFEEQTSIQWDRLPDYNLQFLRAQQNFANDRLKSRGHLFLNEVYEMLGLPHSKEGAIVGWVYGGDGDDFVDFGLFDRGSDEERAYFYYEELSILLDFNVDGIIFDKI